MLSQEQTSGLIEMKKKSEKEISDYNELYGNETYGMTAYILNKIRIYSIPFCFMGIAVGAIFQSANYTKGLFHRTTIYK